MSVDNDAAAITLGVGWRIPTYTQITELLQYCEYFYEVRDGRNFVIFVSRINRKSIEMPAAGNASDGSISDPSELFIWSRTFASANFSYALHLEAVDKIGGMNRFHGLPIRAVFVTEGRGGGDDSRDVPDDDKKIEPEPKPEHDEEKKTVKKSRKKSAS